MKEIIEIISRRQNPYPLDLVEGTPNLKEISRQIRERLGDEYRLLERFAWIWGNYVYELAKKDIRKEIETAF